MRRVASRSIRIPLVICGALVGAMLGSSKASASAGELEHDADVVLDRVVLSDGRELVGRMLTERAVNGELSLEITAGSLVTTLEIPEATIAEVQRGVVPASLHERKWELRDTATDREVVTEAVAEYVMIPIEGRIGIDPNDLDRAAVPAVALERALRFASNRDVEHVVFVIDSPGGHVSEARAMAETMRRYSDRFTYHAVVERSLSAAMWVTLGCDTIHVRDGAMLGGALSYVNTGNAAQYDAKVNGIIAAELSGLARSKGRDGETVRAMVEPVGDRVVTLTESEAIASGVADGGVGTLEELGVLVGAAGWKAAGRVGESAVRRASRELISDERDRQRWFERMIEDLEDAAHAAERIDSAASLARQVDPSGGRIKPREIQVAIGYWRSVLKEADRIGDVYREADRASKRLRKIEVSDVFQVNVDRDRARLDELIERLDGLRVRVERANADATAAIVRLRRQL